MFCVRCHREYPEDYMFCPYDGERTSVRPALDRVRPQPSRVSGSLLGERYRVRGFIAKGAMARIYLAEDEQTGMPVAVKVLDGPATKDETARERFLREAEAASLIGHPNIIEIFDTGEREDGAPYLVMEFLFGESLGAYLDREDTLAVSIALPTLRQVASALQAAHERGVVHRDIKPDNLYLVGEPGDPYDLKVLDFGLSRLQTSQLTAAGVVMGTPMTMAPEQILGEQTDGRADIYALGMVMFRAFVGGWPYGTRAEYGVIAHQVHTPLPTPREFAPDLDPRIEAVILTATRKQPERRYPSMAVLRDDLGRLSDPGAELWAKSEADDHGYEPQTGMGKLVAGSLLRVLAELSVEPESSSLSSLP